METDIAKRKSARTSSRISKTSTVQYIAVPKIAYTKAKRAQEAYVELNQRLERRINEITEMQRLGEERLRQEWVTFKADDQKRWTGYSLSADESMRDLQKTVDKYEERITAIDDANQTIQDQLHQTTDATEQQLQELMNIFHQWLTSYERIMGHVRKTPK